MATAAHCLYCFEVLSAALEKRQPLELPQVEDLWAQYSLANGSKHEEDKQLEADDALAEDSDMGLEDEEDTDEDLAPPALRLPTISRLQASSPASASTSSSSSSTPSSLSTTSSQIALGDSSKSSSKSSFFSIPGRSKQPSPIQKEEEHPLFVTWNTISSRGHQSLRGCIGTFDAQPLQAGIKSYALTAAFDDTRFPPISSSELPSLSCAVTLLTNFTPCTHPLDWDLGTHGIRISFSDRGKRYNSTYLPNVAPEQRWNKEETIVSLMRKAGWGGRGREWRAVSGLRVVRYEGEKAQVGFREFKRWKEWVGGRG